MRLIYFKLPKPTKKEGIKGNSDGVVKQKRALILGIKALLFYREAAKESYFTDFFGDGKDIVARKKHPVGCF